MSTHSGSNKDKLRRMLVDDMTDVLRTTCQRILLRDVGVPNILCVSVKMDKVDLMIEALDRVKKELENARTT